jgi:predicted metal-dependent phosphoesterase TrpH
VKIDLHTHSIASPDGSLSAKHYQKMLASGKLDYVAVTDHNAIDFAQSLQNQLGEQIIVGEEIATNEGEIIGLYLKAAIPAGLSVAETIQAIKDQDGLVYIPHPFETVRKGLSLETLSSILHNVDIIEVHNGRAIFQNKGRQARTWAVENGVVGAAGSDAHGWHGWGKTYSTVRAIPTRRTLVDLLAESTHRAQRPSIRGALYPKLNRIRRRRRRG